MTTKQGKKFPRWVGITAIVIAVLLALTLAFSIITKGWTDLSKFKPKEKEEDAAAEDSGLTFEGGNEHIENGLRLTARKLSKKEYADYGIATIATEKVSSITVTALNEKGEKIDGLHFDWALKWNEGTTGKWGNGKTVTEYISLQINTSTETATLEYKKAFGELIKLTVACREDNTKTATWTIHKREAYNGGIYINWNWDGGTLNPGGSYSPTIDFPDSDAQTFEAFKSTCTAKKISGTVQLSQDNADSTDKFYVKSAHIYSEFGSSYQPIYEKYFNTSASNKCMDVTLTNSEHTNPMNISTSSEFNIYNLFFPNTATIKVSSSWVSYKNELRNFTGTAIKLHVDATYAYEDGKEITANYTYNIRINQSSITNFVSTLQTDVTPGDIYF